MVGIGSREIIKKQEINYDKFNQKEISFLMQETDDVICMNTPPVQCARGWACHKFTALCLF